MIKMFKKNKISYKKILDKEKYKLEEFLNKHVQEKDGSIISLIN